MITYNNTHFKLSFHFCISTAFKISNNSKQIKVNGKSIFRSFLFVAVSIRTRSRRCTWGRRICTRRARSWAAFTVTENCLSTMTIQVNVTRCHRMFQVKIKWYVFFVRKPSLISLSIPTDMFKYCSSLIISFSILALWNKRLYLLFILKNYTK